MNVEAYRHQVGGHCRLLKPKDSSKVCKPLNENEFRFYDKLASLGAPNAEAGPLHILRQFVPKYYGVTEICVHAHYQHEKHGVVNSLQQRQQPTESNRQEHSDTIVSGIRSPSSVACGSKSEGISTYGAALNRGGEGPDIGASHRGLNNSPHGHIPTHINSLNSSAKENTTDLSYPCTEIGGHASTQRRSLYQQVPHDGLGVLLPQDVCGTSNTIRSTLNNKCRNSESSGSTNDPSSPPDGSNANGSCNSSRSCLCIRKHIVLEDLVFGFRKPCVLDLKMGIRQRTLGADAAKEQRQRAKSLETTSHILGFRLCGCQYYNRKTDTLCYRDKYWGRKLTKEKVPQAIRQWFWNGTSVYEDLIPCLMRKLKLFYTCVEQLKHYRFWSSSLLWVYDGGLTDPEARRRSLDIRMIDFANTIYLQDNPSPDEEYLFGLRNLIDGLGALLASCHASIQPPVPAVSSPVGASLCTASTSSGTVAFAEGNVADANGILQQAGAVGTQQDELADKSQDQLCREKQHISVPPLQDQRVRRRSGRCSSAMSSQTSQGEEGASVHYSSQSGLQESAPVSAEDFSGELVEPTSPRRTVPPMSTADSSVREIGIANVPPASTGCENAVGLRRYCEGGMEELVHSCPALVDKRYREREPDALTKVFYRVQDAFVQSVPSCDTGPWSDNRIPSLYAFSGSPSSSVPVNKKVSCGVASSVSGCEPSAHVARSAIHHQGRERMQKSCAESVGDPESSPRGLGKAERVFGNVCPPGSSRKESGVTVAKAMMTCSGSDSLSVDVRSKREVLQEARALDAESMRLQEPPEPVDASRLKEEPFMYTALFRRSVSAPLLCGKPIWRGEPFLNDMAPARLSSGAWNDLTALASARGFVASFFGAAATSDSGVTASDDADDTGDSGLRGDDQATNGSPVNSDVHWRFDGSGASRSSSLSVNSCREGEDAGYEAGDDAGVKDPRQSAPRFRMQDALSRHQEVQRLHRSRRKRFEAMYSGQRMSDMPGVHGFPRMYHQRQRRSEQSACLQDVLNRKRSCSSLPRVNAGNGYLVALSGDAQYHQDLQLPRLQRRWPGNQLHTQRQCHRVPRLRGSGTRAQVCSISQRSAFSRVSDAGFVGDGYKRSVDPSSAYGIQHRKGGGVRVQHVTSTKASVAALRRSSTSTTQSARRKLILQRSALQTLLQEHELRLQQIEEQAHQHGLERQELLVLLGIQPTLLPEEPQNATHWQNSPLRVPRWHRRREGYPAFASTRKGACGNRIMGAADRCGNYFGAFRSGKSASGRRHSVSSLSGVTLDRYVRQAAAMVLPLSRHEKMTCQEPRMFRRRSDTCGHAGGDDVEQASQMGIHTGGSSTSLWGRTTTSPLTGMDLDAVLRLGVGLGLEMGMSRGFGNRRPRTFRSDNRSSATVPAVSRMTGHTAGTQGPPDASLDHWGCGLARSAFLVKSANIQDVNNRQQCQMFRNESRPLMDWIVQQYCGSGRNVELPRRSPSRNDYLCHGDKSTPTGVSSVSHGDRERAPVREGSRSTSSAYCKQEEHHERKK